MRPRADAFRHKTALVTGAGSGIGRELARELARRGAVVVASDRNPGPLREAVDAILQAGGRAEAAPLDVTDAEAVQRTVEETVARHGRLDYLFNNAGIGVGGEARDISLQDWKEVLDVNLHGVVHGVAAAYPVMVRQGFGHIVNTSSVAGLFPLAGEISYVTSKYAVVGLSHALRAESADLGVKVTVVCPGKIETPIYRTSRVVKYPVEKVLSLWPRGMKPETCVRIILRGVERNRATVVVTPLAWTMWLVERASPDLAVGLARLYMKRMRAFRIQDD